MVGITLDLIRKRSEHNEGEISTLEEISLHQEGIERIESLNQTCRNLKILLMQNNVIARIENLNMLKRLEYLNLALNNIEVIENLEGLESLKKLDLTINFIGDLRSVKRLRANENLEILYLTGNPCTDYPGYREYVVANLEQLSELDMTKIERSERILAKQNYSSIEGEVIEACNNYYRTMGAERSMEIEEISSDDDDAESEGKKFWAQKSLHTPQERTAIAKKIERTERKKALERNGGDKRTSKEKAAPRLWDPEGRPYNVNQARIPFKLDEETDPKRIILEVAVYRHLDTRHLEVDLGIDYVRVTIKGKILQLRLPCEILITGSETKRNVTTGRLVVTMPRLVPEVVRLPAAIKPQGRFSVSRSIPKRQLLEIGPPCDGDDMDFSRICRGPAKGPTRKNPVSEDFVDDPEVPPLE